MNPDLTLDQLLSLGGIGTGPYGGGDVVRWSPDGSVLLFYASFGGDAALWILPRAGGFPRRITTAPISLPFLASPQQTFSPDGRFVAYLSDYRGATELWLWELESSKQWPLTTLGNNISSYGWAPDGQSVLVASNRLGTYDIYRVALNDGKATKLTTSSCYEVSPVATPDGQRVLYVRLDQRWQDHEVVSIAAHGGDEQVIVQDYDFFDYHYGRTFGPPVLSPDGKTVLFRSHRSGWINYWAVPVEGGEPRQLFAQECDQSGASWSPDSSQVAFVANHNGTLALWLYDRNSNEARPLLSPEQGVVQAPAWSPDGSTIAFLLAEPTEPQDLWTLEVASNKLERLTDSMPVGGIRERLQRPEKIQYKSFDGLEISAYLYHPVPRVEGQRYSAALIIHGGPTSQFSDAYDSLAQYLARRGYAVLMPNIRGSSGYGKAFEDLNNGDWGHGDLGDAIAGADYLRALPWVDGEHIGITGTSYGGCLSMSAVCNAPEQFQAAASHAGYGDWIFVMDEQEKRHIQLMHYEFGPLAENYETYRRCSPIFNVAKATAPILVLQGEGELPQSESSRRFVDAMRREYKLAEYKSYPGECYYVRSRKHVREMYIDIADFFDRFLRP